MICYVVRVGSARAWGDYGRSGGRCSVKHRSCRYSHLPRDAKDDI